MNDAERNELVAAASQVQQRAYAKYSEYQVGAALRAIAGQIFLGANVENASYGLTMCAERVAVGNAVSAGERSFEALAVASAGGGPPCGACRQVLCEFSDDLLVLLVDVDYSNRVTEVRLSELLPGRFWFPS